MLKKLKKWIRDYIFNPHDRCYEAREHEGIAAMGCCVGLYGGDKRSDNMQYQCMDCPYLVRYKRMKYVIEEVEKL